MLDLLLTPWGIFLCYLLIINLVAFFMMGWDKRQAKKEGARRTPEKKLFAVALLGGSVGAITGMHHFRHKTKHWYFRFGMPAILILQIAGAAAVWYFTR